MKKILLLFFLFFSIINVYSQCFGVDPACKVYIEKLRIESESRMDLVISKNAEINRLKKDNGDLQADNSKKSDCSAITSDRNYWKRKALSYKKERDVWENRFDTTNTRLIAKEKELKVTNKKLIETEKERDAEKKRKEAKVRQLKQKDIELTETKNKLKATTDLLEWYRLQDILNNSLIIDVVDKNGNISEKAINKKPKTKKNHKAERVIIRFGGNESIKGKDIRYIIKRGAKTFDKGTLVLLNGEFRWDREEQNTNKTPKGKYSIKFEIDNIDPETRKDRPLIFITPKNNKFNLKKKK